MFKQASLLVKLSFAFLIIAILVAGVGFYEVRSVNHLNGLVATLVDEDSARKDILNDVKGLTAQMENSALRYETDTQAPKDIATERSEISVTHDELKQAAIDYRDALGSNPSYLPADKVDELGQNIEKLNQAALKLVNSKAANTSSVAADQQKLTQAAQAVDNNADSLVAAEMKHIAAEDREADSYFNELTDTVLLLVGSVLVFSVALGLLIAHTLSSSLRRLTQGASRIANGDFSQQIPVNSNDEVGQLAKTFNDMANRLRDSYHRLELETVRDKTLLESLGEGVIAINEDGKIDLVNNRAVELLELPAQDRLIGAPINNIITLFDDADKPLEEADLPTVIPLKTQRPVTDVYTFRKSAGGKVLVAITADPVVVNGKAAGAIMTLRDVTKEKEVDRMKTEFISLASHQLRTPLSAIKWFTEMLVSGDAGKLQPEQLEFAKNISDSTERMIALVNALLNISRIESGRIMIDPKPTDLKELVGGIVNDLKAKTEEKEQTLIISVHDELPKINLDPRLIGQVYLNLLTNAIKYTPKGGEISVFISKKDDQVISQVTDNGYGIPKDQQGRIFQKFFRAANAVKVETDGTGLGLYLIKSVVESSGGKIWFQSEEGKGTTFWFSIPLSGMKRKEGEVTLDI